jgi:hypothetical protein
MVDPVGKGIYFLNGKSTGTLTLFRRPPNSLRTFCRKTRLNLCFPANHRIAYILVPEPSKPEIWASDLDGNNGYIMGAATPNIVLPFAMREDYGGKAFAVSDDLSSIVYASPSAHRGSLLPRH